ncbi:MAG: alkaline phosphatase PafA [Saprospiraceae bacterium]
MKYRATFPLVLMMILLNIVIAFSQKLERPKLVVGIVVDQMRHDYIYRYWDKYGTGGFKRLINEGFSFENTNYNYVPTTTAPGHSSIYTGSTPSFHGIVGNDWHIRNSTRLMYCVQDDNVLPVGGSLISGKMSPANLLASTVTDELRLFTYDKAKVIGISIKDRGSIIPAGHHPNGAYWFDGITGKFMTSTYYMKALPAWIDNFNKLDLPQKFLDGGWNTLKPIDQYTESMPDLNPYEGKLGSETNAVFPKVFKSEKPNYGLVLSSPFGNTLISELAKAAIEAEGLGKDTITDILAMSYSSTDYAGHLFGLQSVEVEDIYLRLDLELAGMLNYLDQKIGKNNYLVFLSADHAVAQVPQLLKDLNYPGDYFKGAKMIDSLKTILESKFDKYVFDGYSGQQIFLNEERIFNKKLDRKDIVETIKTFVKSWPGVVDVIDHKDIPFLSSANPVYNKIQLGYYPPRSGDLFITLQPGWFESFFTTGTTHGAPFIYDTHVPMLWYGWHIPAGKSYVNYDITDIAPTLSQLLHIPLPSAAFGKVMVEVMKN